MTKPWTGVEWQSPDPKIEIFTKGNASSPDITYCPDPRAGRWANLLSYTFSESVDSLEGSFSFAVEDSGDKEGNTVFDLIPVRSIVKIYEGDLKKPAFVGIIRRCHFESAMTDQGVRRSIVFTGKSIISCISEYTISLDVRIHKVADPTSKRKELTNRLARENMTIEKFMKITWEHFKEVSEEFGISTTGIADIINKFIGGSPGVFVEISGQQKFRYNISHVFYNASNNVIADAWRNILPEPVYEIFSRCNNKGEPRIVARQVPFDPADWRKLDVYGISPLSLVSYALDRDDEEVYTAFMSYIMGSVMSKQFYMGVSQTSNDDIVAHDREKQMIYGFKPLQIDFIGYDRQGNMNDEKKSDLRTELKELNEKMKYWYSRLDEMYSGTITLITDFNQPETNPRVGCRARFLGGEFYIEQAEHSWKYGGTPTIKLTVSRGMNYDLSNGKMMIPMSNVGSKYKELDVTAVGIVGFRPADSVADIVGYKPAKQ